MKKIAMILCLTLWQSTTFAHWEKIDTQQKYQVFLDKDRIKKDDPVKHQGQVWLKFIAHTDSTSDELSAHTYRIIRYAFNCNEKTRAIAELYIYENNKLSFSDEIQEPIFKPVMPGSSAEDYLNQVCKYVYPSL